MPEHMQGEARSQSVWLKPWVVVSALALAVVGAVLVFTGHLKHLLAAVLYVPLLLCLVMHFFMHGHRGHGHRRDTR